MPKAEHAKPHQIRVQVTGNPLVSNGVGVGRSCGRVAPSAPAAGWWRCASPSRTRGCVVEGDVLNRLAARQSSREERCGRRSPGRAAASSLVLRRGHTVRGQIPSLSRSIGVPDRPYEQDQKGNGKHHHRRGADDQQLHRSKQKANRRSHQAIRRTPSQPIRRSAACRNRADLSIVR
jgi:hypothetical protein